MASSPSIPLTALPELVSISQLLHLTFHRNKNQHRLAKWWSSFSQLRRQLSHLITELQNFQSETSKRARKPVIERIDQRVVHLNRHIFPKCYVAFSSVVADQQYASLGLVLIGLVASLKRLLVTSEDIEADTERVNPSIPKASIPGDDLGEPITRDAFRQISTAAEIPGTDQTPESTFAGSGKPREMPENLEVLPPPVPSERPVASKPPRKKRKKGDALDDLFKNLIK